MSYQTILVPYDGSAFSKKALDYAVRMIRNTGGILYLCTVVTIGGMVPPGALLGIARDASKSDIKKRLLKSARDEAENALSLQVEACEKRGVAARYKIITSDNVAEQILKTAKDKKADLIVIGSQGLHGLGRIKSLGSVSRKVSEFADCPVLIVR